MQFLTFYKRNFFLLNFVLLFLIILFVNYLYNFFIEKYSLKNVYNLDLTKLKWCIEKISLEESINIDRYKSTSCNTKIHQFPVNISKVLKLPADNQLYSVVLWTKLPDSFNHNKLNHPAIFISRYF
jgi:hypothetical protein